MSQDRRTRTRERALQARPDDPAAWLVVARELERTGELAQAQAAAVEALRRAPRDPAVEATLEELGWSGCWPAEDGDASGASRSPLPGPREGVVAWRCELPQALIGRPRVDRRRRVVVRGVTSGLYRVDCEGRAIEPLGEWRPSVPPVVAGEEPGAVDPITHRFRAPGWDPGHAARTARDATGESWVASRAGLLALDPHGLPRWRVELPGPVVALRAGTGGPVWVAAPGDRGFLIRAHDRADGQLLAELGFPAAAHPEALVCTPEGGALLACAGALQALAPDGTQRWAWTPSGPLSHLALGPGLLLASTRAGLVALDPESGELRWRRPGLPSSLAPALDADGDAVLVTLDGRVVGIDARGEPRFELTVERRGALDAPALGPGRAYLTAGRWLLAIR